MVNSETQEYSTDPVGYINLTTITFNGATVEQLEEIIKEMRKLI